MSERFYINCSLGPGVFNLTGPEAHHVAVVCRFRAGDPLCLFNGDGREYPARVLEIHRRRVAVEVVGVEQPHRELNFPLQVAATLPKGDRAQFLVEKLTEMGVSSFVPLSSHRSVIEPRETRLEKLQRQVIEASKQCGRNILMGIEPLASWESYCRRGDLPGLKLVAQPGGTPLHDLRPTSLGFTLAVGPEGGFTEEEIARARDSGWLLLDLGPRTLRVETAALVLAAWVVGLT